VRRQCPNLAGLSDEALQRDPRTLTEFAQLVAHRILLVNAQNPGQYLRDATISDLKVMVVEDINDLRAVDVRAPCAQRLDGGGFGQAVGGGFGQRTVQILNGNLVPRRSFGNYFS